MFAQMRPCAVGQKTPSYKSYPQAKITNLKYIQRVIFKVSVSRYGLRSLPGSYSWNGHQDNCLSDMLVKFHQARSLYTNSLWS